jgi:hypothetical protein
VKDCYLQKWDREIKTAKPLLIYSYMKLDHEYEHYLNKVTKFKYRGAMTKLGLSSTGLRI